MRKYEVIEDNAGMLYLAVYEKENPDRLVYLKGDFEQDEHLKELPELIQALKEDEDAVYDWDYNWIDDEEYTEHMDDPYDFYSWFTPYEWGREAEWEVVADNDGLYPDSMGCSAWYLFYPGCEYGCEPE